MGGKPSSGRSRLNQSASRTAKILKAFGAAQRPLGVNELARAVSLPVSVVYRIVASLEQEGLLEQDDETKKYFVSLELLNIASVVPYQMALGRKAYRYMENLSRLSGETINMGILRKTKVLFLSKIESNHLLRTSVSVGSMTEAHCTAIGKVILAFQSEQDVATYLQAASFERCGPNTITTPEALLQRLACVRAKGYAIDHEECTLGTCAIAAPVRNQQGRVVAGLGVSGPTQRLTTPRLADLLPSVIAAANAISQELGYDDGSLTMTHSMLDLEI